MRPRLFHELSRHLAILLEEGIRGGSEESPIPVYLCHPLDVLEGRDRSEAGSGNAIGCLYLYRIARDERLRPVGQVVGAPVELTRPAVDYGVPLWVRLRYLFMVVGGTLEQELSGLAAALQRLHDTPYVAVADLAPETLADAVEVECLPLTLVEEPGAWSELGLEEHRLSLSLEVSVPLSSTQSATVGRIVDRELEVEPREGHRGG